MKALFLPQNDAEPMRFLEGETYREIAAQTNIDFFEMVDTRRLHEKNLSMMVDEEFGAKYETHHHNRRAILASLYPGEIAGDALLIGKAWNAGLGTIDYVSVRDDILNILRDWGVGR